MAGLLHYLFGPGRANEHTDPHLAAAWDPVEALQPRIVDGRHDLKTLTAMLQQPLLADFREKPRRVWHCGLRNAPGDRRLSDAEWDEAVREVLDRTGLAPRGDEGGCRWVAVRHAEDHVHVVVTLARQDGGSVSTNNDFYRVGEACRDLEERFDLRRTGARDRTAGRRPTRGEDEKAQRLGRSETPRVMLRRAVHSAAAISGSPEAFLDELRASGVLVRERRSEQDDSVVTGFAVAWPGDHTADGEPVWFGGSKLAPELSWARLAARWSETEDTAPLLDDAGNEVTSSIADRASSTQEPVEPRLLESGERQAALNQAAACAHRGSRILRSADPDALTTADDVAAAGGDLVAVTGRLLEGRSDGSVSRSADRYQRAARAQWGRSPAPSMAGGALRRAARDLARLGRLRPSERDGVVDLLRATASLIDALADLRESQARLEQAIAAREASTVLQRTAMTLRTAATPDATMPSAALSPRPAVPGVRTARGTS